jgi:hypothetical protein
MKSTLLVVIASFCFSHCFAQKEYTSEKLLEDFDFAVRELHELHQGFYNYEEKERVDSQVAQLRGEINEPMTKLEFYHLTRRLLGLMNEGHGSVDLPKGTMVKTGLSKSFLPLSVRFFDRELIILQNYGEEVEGLYQGVKLLAINGKSVEEIMGDLLPLIPTDGFNETSRYEWIGGRSLSRLYRLVYGESSTFEVEVIGPNETESTLITLPAIRYTQFKSKNKKFETKKFNYQKFTYEQVNDSIAYLSVPSFGVDEWDYPALYEKVFKKIADSNTKHLIMDIQRNTGGTEGNENLLYLYLADERIRKYRKVTMLPRRYSEKKNDKDYIFDQWSMKDSIAERGEFTCYSDYLSDLGYSMPDENLVYKNKLYVLISGLTFSGGAEFASMVRMTDRGVFIGEETGGAFEGNVSGYSTTVKLPHTNIKIDIPTVHFQIDVQPEIKGRGVIPDYEVPQSWGDYLNGVNAKFEFAKKLILD